MESERPGRVEPGHDGVMETLRGVEIERRFFLTHPPDESTLDTLATRVERIEQMYLCKVDGIRRRVRRIDCDGSTQWSLTHKHRLWGGLSADTETVISTDQLPDLFAMIDPGRAAVNKTRWHLPPGQVDGACDLIVDHIFQPYDLWIAEVEYGRLRYLYEPVRLPGWLGANAEITKQPGWRCAALAKRSRPRPNLVAPTGHSQ